MKFPFVSKDIISLVSLTLPSPHLLCFGQHGLIQASTGLWIELRRLPSLMLTEIENDAGTAVARETRVAKRKQMLSFILAVVYWLLKDSI